MVSQARIWSLTVWLSLSTFWYQTPCQGLDQGLSRVLQSEVRNHCSVPDSYCRKQPTYPLLILNASWCLIIWEFKCSWLNVEFPSIVTGSIIFTILCELCSNFYCQPLFSINRINNTNDQWIFYHPSWHQINKTLT